MRKTILYVATLRKTQAEYIGISNDLAQRKRAHKADALRGSASPFHAAIRKHGFEAFDFRVEAEFQTADAAKAAERAAIAERKPRYNATAGGDGAFGCVRSEETKAKLRAANLGRSHSEETRAKLRAAHTGKKHPTSGAKISALAKARAATPDGKAQLDAARALRKSRKGIPLTEAHKENTRKGIIAWWANRKACSG